MALERPVVGASITQQYGVPVSSVVSREPAMWAREDLAYWQWFEGAKFFAHYHPGIDFAAPEGTPIVAAEAGVVTFAGNKNDIDGKQVEVEIRDGVGYSTSHMHAVAVKVGQSVKQGQRIGSVGTTGSTTGPHTHFGVYHRLTDEHNITRTFLQDPNRFFQGGPGAGAKFIQPVSTARYARVKGGGVNIRKSPDLDVGATNIWATSRESGVDGWIGASGIYRRGKGTRYGGLRSPFRVLTVYKNDDGTWVKMVDRYGHARWCHRSLVEIGNG